VTPKNALAFVRSHGIVLEGARGPVPVLAEVVAGSAFKAGGGVIPRDTTFLLRLVLSGTHQTCLFVACWVAK
jgi:hypothetical protein